MTRTIAAMAAAVLLSAAPALAEDDGALKAAAEAYLHHPVVQQTFADMWSVDTMRSAIVAQSRAHGRALTDGQIETPTRIIHEELIRTRPQFDALIKHAVVETFSLEEIRALNGFLDSELGGRAMAKSGAVMRSFNAGAAPMFAALFKRLGARFKAEFGK